MDQGDLEGTADAIIRAAGGEPDERPKARAVVSLVASRVEFGRGLWGDAEIVRVHDEWRIYVRRNLSPARRLFATYHEVAERWLQEHEGWIADESLLETAANGVAAAMVMPRRAVQKALRAGLDRPALAKAFVATETHVAIREAEVSGAPRVVVTPARLYARGEAHWAPEPVLRRWRNRPPPEVIVQPILDDPRRWLVDPRQTEE